ncbi:MAG: nicotinate phosphoribosyltransferase [Chroococcidiopsidaceae cyanobacterium CP_BM_RX_35]|nr:nicotinate phosphoribosyltransferase [Chroococcidiopsidaceae cyanobacterium CP_BM_RX_35]
MTTSTDSTDWGCLFPHSLQVESQPARALTVTPEDYSLLTDLYELTMVACYIGEGLEQSRASFELSVRRLPAGFGYLIAMGLAQALEYLEKLHFNSAQLSALQATGIFANAPERFWRLLAEARFTGDVWAVPEGTAIFASEPLLRVEAPLWQAQLVETYLLNALNYQTLVATRAARLRDVAGQRANLIDFGTRRAFSPQAALWAARAALASGLDSTSNVLAALQLGRKPSGTMAHALVMAIAATQGSEAEAFTAFQRYFPNGTLLIDTYDTLTAAQGLAERLAKEEIELAGVRLDSGDLVALSQQVRSLLPGVPIFASGDLDEWEIAKLLRAGACIDGYGLGTRLVTGTPVNGVYKLVEIDDIPVMKESSGKMTYPGRKQIFRSLEGGQFKRDRLGLMTESPEREVPLLQLVMKQGQRISEPETLEEIRVRTAASVAALPSQTRELDAPMSLPMDISAALLQLTEQTQKINEPQRR